MKYCEEYAALLDLFVDGELAGPEMERVRDHLAACPGCRAYVDDALAMRAGFPNVEEADVPEGFAQGVMERIRETSNRKSAELRRRGIRRWMGTAAALAACCALVILVRTGSAGENRTAAPAGGDSAACDRAGIVEGEEAGIAPQAAPEAGIAAQMAPAEAPTEKNDFTARAGGQEEAALAAPKAAVESAADESGLENTAALCLTAEEAGDLLKDFTAVWENAVEWRYELNREEYQALLEALGRPEELPDGAQGPFLVVVTGPKE